MSHNLQTDLCLKTVPTVSWKGKEDQSKETATKKADHIRTAMLTVKKSAEKFPLFMSAVFMRMSCSLLSSPSENLALPSVRPHFVAVVAFLGPRASERAICQGRKMKTRRAHFDFFGVEQASESCSVTSSVAIPVHTTVQYSTVVMASLGKRRKEPRFLLLLWLSLFPSQPTT